LVGLRKGIPDEPDEERRSGEETKVFDVFLLFLSQELT